MSKSEKFMEVLGKMGMWCAQNKYLSAIKNAFIACMPITIAGAFGVLWSNVIVNESTGLGQIWHPIMALSFLNPIFDALSFVGNSCISVALVVLVASEIGSSNGEKGMFPGVLGLLSWIAVTPVHFAGGDLTVTLANQTTVTVASLLPKGATVSGYSGILSSYTGSSGIFTALIVGIVSMEIYNFFRKMDKLKIKMPEQVPPGVASSFESLFPTVFELLTVSTIGQVIYALTGNYTNDLISALIQKPLQNLAGNNILVALGCYLLISLFWIVGMHGTSLVPTTTIFRPMLYYNMAIFQGTATAEQIKHGYYPINSIMLTVFGEFGGSGLTLGLVLSILFFGKREDNKAIAKLSLVPGLFNINETMTFGMPIVMNPILSIPFVLAPMASILMGWILVITGFCPPFVLQVPWTTPPILFAFIASGGKIMAAVSQLMALVLVTAIYAPFLIIYEKYQNRMEQAEA